MKKISIMILAVCSLFKAQAQSYPTALIELFSSEGCSSCVLADGFLKQIIDIADSTQTPAFCIDYHVDIWNRSGWVDKFSDTSFSRRQREYMVKSGQTALFTPMVFVNGKGAFPGGAKKEIGAAMNYELGANPTTQLTLKSGYISATRTLTTNYEITGKTDSCSINLVLAYKEVKNEVTGGENAGKTLIHHHTALKWQRADITAEKKGNIAITIPEGINVKDLMIIGFVQHERTWHILTSEQILF